MTSIPPATTTQALSSISERTATLAATAISQATGTAKVSCPGQTGKTVANAACCALFPLLSDLQTLFTIDVNDSQCPESARGFLRLAFHDAMGFSMTNPQIGDGADGSILTFSDTELSYKVNAGLVDKVTLLKPLGLAHNLSDGDVLHFAAAAGLATCPGAPSLSFLLGRPAAKRAASANMPGPALPTDDVTTILARFHDVGFTPDEVIALLAAHSTGSNYVLDPMAVQAPFDTTPEMFDSQFYIETLLPGKFGNESVSGEVQAQQPGIVRLQSDFLLARDSRTTCKWQGLMGNQAVMAAEFQSAMLKLQILGQDSSLLTDCSDVISPAPGLPNGVRPHIPAGYRFQDLDLSQTCSTSNPTPTTFIPSDPGSVTFASAE
ncbi:manganese peroxidase [Agrocybe pediades]|nr:manganese peroxidase [Agrocybe pediades]